MPGLQGLQGRLPGQRRHGDVQGRVPVALLRGTSRPRHAYAFGLIHWWARLASQRAARSPTSSRRRPGSRTLAKLVAGMPQRAQLPRVRARTTFQALVSRAGRPGHRRSRRVILWPDTFNNHFHPRTGASPPSRCSSAPASRCDIPLPSAVLRPAALRLRHARHAPRRGCATILDALRPQIDAGMPIVGLEPSCVAVFRDELREPACPTTRTPSGWHSRRSCSASFSTQKATASPAARCTARALVHGHCHHKAIIGMDDDDALLDEHGARLRACSTPAAAAWPARSASSATTTTSRSRAASASCCRRCARADDDTLIVADGFSCREQIAQTTDRRAMHICGGAARWR